MDKKPDYEQVAAELAAKLSVAEEHRHRLARENQLIRQHILKGIETLEAYLEPNLQDIVVTQLREDLKQATALLCQVPTKPGTRVPATLTRLIGAELARRGIR